jgi:uncharacterized protein
MYLYHRYVEENFTGISDVPLSPLLATTGEAFEVEQLEYLLEARTYSVGPADEELTASEATLSFDETWSGDDETDIDRFTNLVREVATGDQTQPVVFYQPRIRGTVGAWPVVGDADIVIATPTGSTVKPEVELRVAELKSSNAVKTHHQLQAAIYTLLFSDILSDIDVQVTASIVSQDSEQADLGSTLTARGDLDLRRLPTFDLDTRQNDVQLLLEAGGTLDEILLDGDEMREGGEPPNYRIDQRCDGCSKQAKCLAHSVTNQRLSLLGLAEGIQESLREFGITSLRGLAELYEWPTGSYWATMNETPRPRNPELVTRILRETEISNLMQLAQIAHRFLRELSPAYDEEWEEQGGTAGPWSDYLIGSGRNLPDDDPPEKFDLGYPRKSLVRVYPYVQHDFVRNRVVFLAAKVTCTRYEENEGDGIFITARPEALPTDSDVKKDEEERRLIETFYNRLSEVIDEVRPDLREDGYSSTEGFLHIYPYGNQQRQALVDAVKRHPDSGAAQAFRTLLGYREDIDQEVVTVLRDEFRERHAFRYPGLGLVQTAAQFYSGESDLDWEGPRDSESTPLKQVFAADFFETAVPYDDSLRDRIMLQFEDGLQVPNDRYSNYYPVVGRHQETLPLEYPYASEEFDRIKPEWAEDDEMRQRIIRYRHHTDEASPRVSLDDIADVVHAICDAYEHIERSISQRDASLAKEPLNLAELQQNTLGVSELQSTLLEYQELEFGSSRRELESRYRKSLGQRVAVGQAIPFEVTNAPVESDDEAEAQEWVGGEVLRSLGDTADDGLQPDTPLALETGSFVVMTPLTKEDDGTLVEDLEDRTRIQNQVLGLLTNVDSESGTVRVSLNWQTNQKAKRFRPHHVGWTSHEDDDYDRRYIKEGMQFVLDTALDDFVAHYAHAALEHATENDVHNRLVNLYDDEVADALQMAEPLFDPDGVRSFIEAFDHVMPESTNRDQETFISRVDHTVAALQGPPGTGKTAYASAPAILARAYASSSEAFAGVASAHSNTAVDEVASAVGEAQQRLAEEGVLEDAKLIRVQSGSTTGELPDNVAEYQYFDDREELQSIFETYVLADRSPGPLVIFATPVTLRNLVNSVRWAIDDDARNVSELMSDGRARLFDFALVDEASMMDLPLLFLVGAFLGHDKQLLLVGDHRQMPPIQAHDWEAEDRETIEENTPAVSALDFIRFLRGDDDSNFEQLERDRPQWSDKDSVLPMDRLEITYRLPPAMARFQTDLFYYRDDITLEAGSPPKFIPDVREAGTPAWLEVALDPKARVSLLIHDDNAFTKDSPVEAYLAERLLDPLPVVREMPEDAGEDILTGGVVVPFRLMRRRLQHRLDLTVDTVERFQGGERDVMVMAMTAGNQGYVDQLSEFLLDANRFNVASSRMKRKLFIIVSKSLFRAVSSDPRKYEQQKAWKQLYQELVAGKTPEATLELTGREVSELDGRTVSVQVFTGYRE